MKERDKLHRQATLNSDPVLFSHYKELKNKITFEITQKKKDYVTNIIGQSKNSRNLWNAVNTVTGKKITSDSTPSELNCSEMNSYFATIGKKLHNKFRQVENQK